MTPAASNLLPVVRDVVVRVRERPAQALELQRRELVAARALDRLEVAGTASLDGHRRRHRRQCRLRRSASSITWPLIAIALAAEQRDRLAALVGDLDVVDAGAAARAALVRARGQHVALARRREEVDRCSPTRR